MNVSRLWCWLGGLQQQPGTHTSTHTMLQYYNVSGVEASTGPQPAGGYILFYFGQGDNMLSGLVKCPITSITHVSTISIYMI